MRERVMLKDPPNCPIRFSGMRRLKQQDRITRACVNACYWQKAADDCSRRPQLERAPDGRQWVDHWTEALEQVREWLRWGGLKA